MLSKSLSVPDMMKLGKIIDSRKTTVVDLYSFDLDLMTWSKVPQTVEFLVEANPLGQGGFRSVYKTTTHHAEFKKCSWVIKKYLPDAVAPLKQQTTLWKTTIGCPMHMRWHATLLFS